MATPLILSWSGGKDSALALHELRRRPDVDVVGLITTVTDTYDRISIHGVRRDVLQAQVEQIGLPLHEVVIKAGSTNRTYEAAFALALEHVRSLAPALATIAFGDLFLEDVRAYREHLLTPLGWNAVFPLWGRPTPALAQEFVREGFRAILCCVDTEQAPAALAGREFDAALLADLPPTVDPCGERGEFHTCVYAGPIFRRPIALTTGERVLREERFQYCDLLLAD